MSSLVRVRVQPELVPGAGAGESPQRSGRVRTEPDVPVCARQDTEATRLRRSSSSPRILRSSRGGGGEARGVHVQSGESSRGVLSEGGGRRLRSPRHPGSLRTGTSLRLLEENNPNPSRNPAGPELSPDAPPTYFQKEEKKSPVEKKRTKKKQQEEVRGRTAALLLLSAPLSARSSSVRRKQNSASPLPKFLLRAHQTRSERCRGGAGATERRSAQ